MTRLSALVSGLEAKGLLAQSAESLDDVEIDHVTHDSRVVGQYGLFVAIRGDVADGHVFIDKAVKNGAVAIVCEEVPENAEVRFSGTSFVRVANSRRALALLAAMIYANPAQELSIAGVTGTNGKTTTSVLLHHLLSTHGHKTGLIGTIEVLIGLQSIPVTHTTPDAVELQGMLRKMANEGCSHVSMEVSSHALDQWRVDGIDYDVAVFTNMTRDHLDYHATYDDYFAAKKKLFDRLPTSAVAVVNLDDPAGSSIVADTRATVVTYGFGEGADIQIQVLENSVRGLRLRIDGHERDFNLVGRFNAYNLSAAYGAAIALGLSGEAAIDGLSTASPVSGRFEQVRFADGTTVIVDYAHTPDALENVLRTINETREATQNVWCVFGCGGNRDVSKRRMMGAIAEQLAETVIVTSDNPRNEDPRAIMNDIRRGMSRPAEVEWIEDRRDAIRFAARNAAPGDVVLIAGKGHETYQIIGDERRPFDDRAEVRESFEHRNQSE